jgi:hypothetical protein
VAEVVSDKRSISFPSAFGFIQALGFWGDGIKNQPLETYAQNLMTSDSGAEPDGTQYNIDIISHERNFIAVENFFIVV